MSTFSISDLEPLMPEIVDSTVTKQFHEDNSLYNKFAEGKGEKINGRGVRITSYISPNASDGFFAEGGAYPTPDKEEFIEMKVFPTRYGKGLEFTGDVIDQWSSRDDVIDGVTDRLSRATASAKQFLQRMIFGDGSGSLGVITGDASTATITFATTYAGGDTLGAWRVKKRQKVNIYDSTLATLRDSGQSYAGVFTVSSKTGTTAVLDANPSDTLSAGDVVVPAGSLNKAFHGLKYIVNNNSGEFQGQSRTTYPQLKANVVDANGAAITVALLTKTKAQQKFLASKDASNIMLLSSLAQKNLYERQGTNLIRIEQGDKFNGAMGNGDVGHGQSDWQDCVDCEADRLYGLSMASIKRYEAKPFGFYNYDGTSWIRYQSNGTASDKISGWLGVKMEFGSPAPQENFLIKNLSISDAPLSTVAGY